jgi:hypothetical protein
LILLSSFFFSIFLFSLFSFSFARLTSNSAFASAYFFLYTWSWGCSSCVLFNLIL